MRIKEGRRRRSFCQKTQNRGWLWGKKTEASGK